MTVHERMLALNIIKKLEKDPDYAQQIGISASMRSTKEKAEESK